MEIHNTWRFEYIANKEPRENHCQVFISQPQLGLPRQGSEPESLCSQYQTEVGPHRTARRELEQIYLNKKTCIIKEAKESEAGIDRGKRLKRGTGPQNEWLAGLGPIPLGCIFDDLLYGIQSVGGDECL
jgi:hypothetical protein